MKILWVGEIDENCVRCINLIAADNEVSVLSFFKPEFDIDVKKVFIGRLEEDFTLQTDSMYDVLIYWKKEKLQLEAENAILAFATNNKIPNVLVIAMEEQMDVDDVDFTELLCEKFRKDKKLVITQLRLPEIYSAEQAPNFLYHAYMKLRETGSCCFHGMENSIYDAMHIEDACALIQAILKSQYFPNRTIICSSNNAFPLKNLMEILEKQFPFVVIKNDAVRICTPSQYDVVDGWIPRHIFLNEIAQILTSLECIYGKLRCKKRQQLMQCIGRWVTFFLAIGLLIIYHKVIPTASELQYVDLNLLFIVISSLVYARYYGILAAAACCIMSIGQALQNGTQWSVLFYHVDNWIPIFVYWITAFVFLLYQNRTIRIGSS